MHLSTKHYERFALLLIVLITGLLTVAWIAYDTRPQPSADPNTYFIKTLNLVDDLKASGVKNLWQSLTDASIDGRPPLYQLITVPFILLFGRSEDVALSVNLISQITLILATYGIGSLAWNRKSGLLAAFLVATYPPLIQFSTIYLVRAWLPAWVAVCVWELLLLIKNRSIKVAWLLGISLSLGMLIHPEFLYLIPLPAIGICLYVLLFEHSPGRTPPTKGKLQRIFYLLKDTFLLWGLLPAGIAAIGLAVGWYLPNNQTIFALENDIALFWSDQTYGFNWLPHSFWWYALTSPGAISTILVILFILGFLVSLFIGKKETLALCFSFICIYFSQALRQGTYGWLNFSPVLPVVAAITSVGIFAIGGLFEKIRMTITKISNLSPDAKSSQIGLHVRRMLKFLSNVFTENQGRWHKIISIILAVLCIGVATFNYYFVAWGNESYSQLIANALVSPMKNGFCGARIILAFCPVPPKRENWQVNEIINFILAQLDCQSHRCNVVIVPKQDTFNSIIFNSAVLRDFPESQHNIQISSADGWSGAPGDGKWVLADYLVYIPSWRGMDAPREIQIGTELTQMLEYPPPTFYRYHQEIASFDLPGGMKAKVVKGSKPPTIDEEIQSYDEALQWVPDDIMLYEKLGYLFLRMDQFSSAEEVFKKASQKDPQRAWPYRALGYIYQKQGRNDQAIKAFRQAITLEPYDPNAYRSLVDLYVTDGDFERAIEIYKLADKQNPRFTWPHELLGSLYIYNNKYTEAQREFQIVSLMTPLNLADKGTLDNLYWNPSSQLGAFKAFIGSTPLELWRGNSWVQPDPAAQDVLIGLSNLSVGGKTRSGQIHIAPASINQPTILRFSVKDNLFDILQVGSGLADQVNGLSNGVQYSIRLSLDGGKSYITLINQIIDNNVWHSQFVPLSGYKGKDLVFELVVDSLNDVNFDWLQTVLQLIPDRKIWDLGSNLADVQVTTDSTSLSWNDLSGWKDYYGSAFVALSESPVQGKPLANKVLFHPYNSNQDTTISFSIPDNPYATLATSYALADEVVGRSDGVRYTILISTDGKNFTKMLENDVANNQWNTTMIDLKAFLHKDLLIKLLSSSKGNDNFDWLQLTLDLF